MDLVANEHTSFEEGMTDLMVTAHRDQMPIILGVEHGYPICILTLEAYNDLLPEDCKLDLDHIAKVVEEKRQEAIDLINAETQLTHDQ